MNPRCYQCNAPGVRKVTAAIWKCAACYERDRAHPWGACEREISDEKTKGRRR